MQLKKVKVRTKCDNGACRNYADYEIVREDTMLAVRLRLCENCLREIGNLAQSICDEPDLKIQKSNKTK